MMMYDIIFFRIIFKYLIFLIIIFSQVLCHLLLIGSQLMTIQASKRLLFVN